MNINCYLLSSQRKLGACVGSEILAGFILICVKASFLESLFQNSCKLYAFRGDMYLNLR